MCNEVSDDDADCMKVDIKTEESKVAADNGNEDNIKAKNESKAENKKSKKHQKATEEKATEYIRRYHRLLHENEKPSPVYEEWKREQEAKGVVFKDAPWVLTPPNPNMPDIGNHPLLDLFHREVRYYGDDEPKKKFNECDEESVDFKVALSTVDKCESNESNNDEDKDKTNENDKNEKK